MPLTFAQSGTPSIPLVALDSGRLAEWLSTLPEAQRTWIDACGFTAALGSAVILPGPDGRPERALVGMGTAAKRARGRFALAAAAARLPAGTYHIEAMPDDTDIAVQSLGWLMAQYGYDRYAKVDGIKARLVASEGIDAPRIEAIAAGEALTRDLINTPSSDMGPQELEDAARALAAEFGATTEVTAAEALLGANFPMIHAVGRASTRAPRLIDMRWGTAGPMLTLVGKGVCFDTGGLNLKPASSMGLMKKDMGGAATVLGLARMIMATGMLLRLRVLIPAVENVVSGNAMRPGDVLTSRKGLTVEINNTDAEGRLVLADALTLAAEEEPALIVSMATLTGAARVAVGPDLAPFYAGTDAQAAALGAAAARVADPVWRMPFWDPYEPMIEPGIADLDNAPSGGMAGSVTAALFLRRFVQDPERYMHFDIYGWQPTAAPGRPKGGVGQGARALLEALPGMLGL